MFIFSSSGNIQDLSASDNGELCATISDDKAMKVFDVVNFGKCPFRYKIISLYSNKIQKLLLFQ